MNDMEKAQILYNLRENFQVDEEVFSKLFHQIENEDIKKNFTRIIKGLKTEDNYKLVFSSLPWIKNINAIHQEQEKKHKENYQTPDYMLLVENSKKENFPIFIDVKTVKESKQSCELMVKQIHTLKNYAKDNNAHFLVAIFWEKFGYWTHNALSSFGGKKKNKLSFEEAVKNDLSHILSDYVYLIDKPIYRKTVFNPQVKDSGCRHETHGEIANIYIGNSLDKLKECTIIESSIIDSAFDMVQVELIKDENEIIQIDKLKHQSMIIKTSKWVVNFVNIWHADLSERLESNQTLMTEIGRIHIVELMKDLQFKPIYLIPAIKNKEIESFFRKAYSESYVWDNYLASINV